MKISDRRFLWFIFYHIIAHHNLATFRNRILISRSDLKALTLRECPSLPRIYKHNLLIADFHTLKFNLSDYHFYLQSILQFPASKIPNLIANQRLFLRIFV